jgi:hypothetical protein
MKVPAACSPEVDRDTFIDPLRIVDVSGASTPATAAVEAPFVRHVALHREAWYVRTATGLYRMVGSCRASRAHRRSDAAHLRAGRFRQHPRQPEGRRAGVGREPVVSKGPA